MRDDSSMDQEIRMLERRIEDRRVALRDSLDDLGRAATAAGQRARKRIASPAFLGGAMLAGFVAARLTRGHVDGSASAGSRGPGGKSTSRRVIGALASAGVPLALRAARHAAEPWITRAVNRAQGRYERRYTRP